MEKFLKFANELADNSGKVIRKYYRNFGDIESKSDLSPVTIADKKAEQVIRDLIKQRFPEHGIQGEEFGIENGEAEYKWVIDPIDGTASFIIGRPLFGSLIALLHKGEPIIGLIDQPISGERWVAAKGSKAFFINSAGTVSGTELRVRECDSLTKAVICTTGPQYFSAEQQVKFNKISAAARYVVYGGDCYNYALLSMGTVDAVVEAGLKLHDFMALKVIVEEAGGIATDWQGKKLCADSKGDVVMAGDKRVHKEIIDSLK